MAETKTILGVRVDSHQRSKVRNVAEALGVSESDALRLILDAIDLGTLLQLVVKRHQAATQTNGATNDI